MYALVGIKSAKRGDEWWLFASQTNNSACTRCDLRRVNTLAAKKTEIVFQIVRHGVLDADAVTPRIGVPPLPAEELYRSTYLWHLKFSTTAELQPTDGPVGRTRAVDGLRFETHTGKAGFNLFVIGPNGAQNAGGRQEYCGRGSPVNTEPFRSGSMLTISRTLNDRSRRTSCWLCAKIPD